MSNNLIYISVPTSNMINYLIFCDLCDISVPRYLTSTDSSAILNALGFSGTLLFMLFPNPPKLDFLLDIFYETHSSVQPGVIFKTFFPIKYNHQSTNEQQII